MTSSEKYTKAVMEACNEMRLDYFPQVEASELLYKVITLKDIYLPLSLGTSSNDVPSSGRYYSNIDVDELMRRIDEKIAALEALDAKEAQKDTADYTDENKTIESTEAQKQESAITQANTGLRLLIEANPGSGKTTFCKRMVMAMLNRDESFFQKYSEENDLHLSSDALPILVSCKNIADLSVDDLVSLNFQQLMYKLCVLNIGLHFSGITEDEFGELIDSYKAEKICIILDGWDEILNTEKEAAFCENMNRYLEQNPCIDTIITIRVSYVAPELLQPYSARYRIRPLSDDDIREFCKKWCEVILNPNQQRAKSYSLIAEQILSSKEQQVRLMMRNPLDLSLLLTVSKNDGRLPENKAELFKELVDLYIFWSTNKSKCSLSAKSIRVFLAYIASIFTKNKKLICDEEELLHLIRQAITDLEWTFSEDITCFEPHSIAKELSHTGILTRTYDGTGYSFSESKRITTHRQMQEYLTAYAILAQYSDEEYNNMSPIEIFEDKYGIRQWREVILFIVLMNNGRLRQELIKRLIAKAEATPEDNYVYTNLLFDLIVNGADIRLTDKHKIYDIIFSKHITDQQIVNIILLVTSSNRCSSDFMAYINAMFTDSVKNGDSEYGYANAVIEASIALQQGKSPFSHAEALMQSDQNVDIAAGSQILLIMAWCKYASVDNAFSSYFAHYKMPSEWINVFKIHIEKQRVTTILLKSVREAIIADFASFNDFFSAEEVAQTCLDINVPNKTVDCELILSIAPVFDSSFQQQTDIDPGVQSKYLQKLNAEIACKNYDEIALTFCICVSLGCFSLEEREEKWKEIDEIYKGIRDSGSIGKARYAKLKKSIMQKGLSGFLEHIELGSDFSPSNHDSTSLTYWVLNEWNDAFAIYLTDSEKMKIAFPVGGLTPDARRFLHKSFQKSITTKNNLAYLLRRHEIDTIATGEDFSHFMSPEQLLEEGVQTFEFFSVINYALSVAGIYANEKGDYTVGKDYLTSIKSSLRSDSQQWFFVVNWWRDLSLNRNEYEGLVVLTWLYVLGFLDVDSIDHQLLRALSKKLQEADRNIEDFDLFNKTILAIIE